EDAEEQPERLVDDFRHRALLPRPPLKSHVSVLVLRVLPFDLDARFADLFDDEKRWMLLDHPLDSLILVPGDDDEPITLLHDLLVFLRGHLDLLDARSAGAFAVKGQS